MDEHFGGILDILINNVGTNIRKTTVDYTPEEFLKVVDTNFNSVFLLTQASVGIRVRVRNVFYTIYSWFLSRFPQ